MSSCWNSGRHTDGYAMVEELAAMGFSRIELSHGIRISLVPGILKALEEELIEISGVHNFCPLPSGVHHAAPNFYQPSSPSRGERDLWQNYSMKTLEFAKRVGGKYMVAHSGSLQFFLGNPVAGVERYIKRWNRENGDPLSNLSADPRYGKLLGRGLAKIRKKEYKTGSRVAECYQPVVAEAVEKRIDVCIENREKLEELPTDERIAQFIEAMGEPGVVKYWHDCGHAQIKHLLGVRKHREFLESNRPYLAGFHLHDVSDSGRDHLPLGSGCIDWKMVQEFIEPTHHCVLELNPKVSRREVLDSKSFLESMLSN